MTYPVKTLNQPIGWWQATRPPQTGETAICSAISNINRPVYILNTPNGQGVSQEGTARLGADASAEANGFPLMAYAPRLMPEDLGDDAFKKTHNLKYPYICGAMANGITSVEMVEAAGNAGMVGFFGAAGLTIDKIEHAIHELQKRLGHLPYGVNLIHSPNDPALEMTTVQLYLSKGVRLISASAYLALTLPLVYFRVAGIHEDPEGNIVCPNRVIAKVSRIEIAQKFLSPPPEKILAQLVEKGFISAQEANLARKIPVAEDLTAEADSGGHTDNRPALSLLPTMIALRDEIARQHQYRRTPCIGLGGGISTPYATAAAFALGAAYVITGSVNQSCIEAGTSPGVKKLLAQARQADVAMAPAADMFEIGARVQVLKRGTMFALRAAKLHDLYNRHDRFENIDPAQQTILERDFFKCSFEEEWQQTKAYFSKVDPRQITRAQQDPKHKMALVFRSYLGQSSMWAVKGIADRQMDYQIWCGPAMGAFNQWVKESFLENPGNRKVATVAMNLLAGACVVTRSQWLKNQGVLLPPDAGNFAPLTDSEIKDIIVHNNNEN